MIRKKFEVLVFLCICTIFNITWILFKLDSITFNFIYVLFLFGFLFRFILCPHVYIGDINYFGKDYVDNPKVSYKLTRNLQSQYEIYCKKENGKFSSKYWVKLDSNLCGLNMDKLTSQEFKIFAEQYNNTVTIYNLMNDNYTYVKDIKESYDDNKMTYNSLRWLTFLLASMLFLIVYTNHSDHIRNVLEKTFSYNSNYTNYQPYYENSDYYYYNETYD